MVWYVFYAFSQTAWTRLNLRKDVAPVISSFISWDTVHIIWDHKIRKGVRTSTHYSPLRSGCCFDNAVVKLILFNSIFRSSNGNALRWMPRDLSGEKSSLVQVMAWCRQAPSHCLSKCWPRSMSPNGITRPQWVKFKSISTHTSYILHYYHVARAPLNTEHW